MAAQGRRRAAAAAGCVTLVALLASGCGTSGSGGEAQRAAPAEPAPLVSGLAAYVAKSEGRTVVVTGSLDDSSWRVYRVPGDPAPGRVRLAASANGRVVAVSVHAKSGFTMTSLHVLDVRSASLRRLPLAEGAVRVPLPPAVSPDGATIVFADAVDLSILPTDGGASRRLRATLGTPAPSGTTLGRMTLSPDGRSLVYELWRTDPDDPRPATTAVEFVLLSLARPRPRALLTSLGPDASPAAWSPDSRRVAVAGDPYGGDSIEIIDIQAGGRASVTGVFPGDLVWTRRGIYTFARTDPDALPNQLVLVDPDARVRRTIAQQRWISSGRIVAPPSGDVVALLAGPRLRVFSPTGASVLDRTLRGSPDAPLDAEGYVTVVLVDP